MGPKVTSRILISSSCFSSCSTQACFGLCIWARHVVRSLGLEAVGMVPEPSAVQNVLVALTSLYRWQTATK